MTRNTILADSSDIEYEFPIDNPKKPLLLGVDISKSTKLLNGVPIVTLTFDLDVDLLYSGAIITQGDLRRA